MIPVSPKFETRRMAINIVDNLANPTVLLPPLYLHINPASLQMSFTKKINRTQTFSAFVEEYWGEELDSLSCSGSTGGFMHEDLGLTTIERNKTAPFFKFQDILDIYRNNGNVYDDKGRVIQKGNIVISFYPDTWLGYFESFTYQEDATSPFRFTFDFVFKVEKSYTGV